MKRVTVRVTQLTVQVINKQLSIISTQAGEKIRNRGKSANDSFTRLTFKCHKQLSATKLSKKAKFIHRYSRYLCCCLKSDQH